MEGISLRPLVDKATSYPDIFESAINYFFLDLKFPRLHVSVFKSNLLVHTYPIRFRINSVFKNFHSGGPIQKV